MWEGGRFVGTPWKAFRHPVRTVPEISRCRAGERALYWVNNGEMILRPRRYRPGQDVICHYKRRLRTEFDSKLSFLF
jgi:hypothetical protein